MAVVKADAYGHGVAPVARAMRRAEVRWLGVALPTEALALRAQGDDGRILAWLWSPQDPAIASCVREGVDLSVSTPWALAEIVEAADRVGRPADIHVKVDTGLWRNGAPAASLPDLLDAVARAVQAGSVRLEGMWSHLADADVPDAASLETQRGRFDAALDQAEARGLRPRVRHVGSTGSLWTAPQCQYDLVRVGIGLYGLTPGDALGTAADLGLVPAMTLVTRLANVKRIDVGERVSYGGTWTAAEPTMLGLVPLGYADGLPRSAGGVAAVLVGDRLCPIVGRVAMDQCVVDLGAASVARAGDEVVVFGPGSRGERTADDWASSLGTIGYELVTRLGSRVPREYVGVS
jgi:alanine racemase